MPEKIVCLKGKTNMTVQTTKEGTTLTVRIVGQLNTLTAPELDHRMHAELRGIGTVVMDMEAVTYISSAGLRVLLTIKQTIEDCGGRLKVINCNETITQVLDMIGFLTFLTNK